jgi:hypothetical protein
LFSLSSIASPSFALTLSNFSLPRRILDVFRDVERRL